jgi:hypothetical protein
MGEEERKSDSSEEETDTGDSLVEMASSRAMDRGSSVIPGSWYGESGPSSALPLPLSIDGCGILAGPSPPSVLGCLDMARSTD